MKHLKFAWLLLVLLTLAACGQDVAPDTLKATDTAAPTITSDKDDYAPGELVTLTGSNWQAGESVHINVDDDQTKRWERNVNVTADENGNITDQFNLPDVFVATYQVVATGEQSGKATTMFTDGNARFVTSGPTITNASWIKYSTSNCSGGNNARLDSAINVTMTSSAGQTLAIGIVDGQSAQVTVPATAGTPTQNFSSWSPKTSGDPFTVSGDGSRTICVPGFLNGNRDYQANYTAATAPSVTTHPANASITYGNNASFTAAASGSPTPTVQWQKSTDGTAWTNISEATSGTLSLTKPPVSDSGSKYRAVFTNSAGSATSNAATLTVNKANTSTAVTSSQSPSIEGQSVTFTASVSVTSPDAGTASGNVQFKVDGSNAGSSVALNSSAKATFTTSSLAVGNRSVTAEYLGSGNYSSSTSTELIQKVNSACVAPSIKTQPTDEASTVGGAATFTVTADGTGPLSYQWRKGDDDIQGARNANYDLTALKTADAGKYSVTVTNSCGTVTSNAATLTVNKASATISLGNLTHTYDGSAKAATATTKPEGLDGLSISYSQNGNAVSRPTNAGSYRVVATLDNPSYSAEEATGTLVIGKADQAISWDAPEAITYGAALGDDQLNATRTKGDGALSYDPPAGSVLGAGTRTLKVTAAETANFNSTSKEVSLTVNRAEQAISWSNPAAITYDTPLGAAQLNARLTKGDGALTYNPAIGATLPVGTHTLKVTAAETANYKVATAEVTLTVNKVNQEIAWNAPAAITYGTPLGEAQLNADLTKGDGALSYIPRAGTVLGAGTHTLTVKAAETDNSYEATKQVSITVNKADQTISFTGAPSTAVFGSKFTVNAAGGASGESVRLGASGACTISGSEVTMTSGTGTCSLTADQNGSNNYNAARQATQSTTAQKATATVTLSNLSHIFDGSAKSATVTTNPSGLRVATTYSGSSSAPSAVGSNYNVVATIDDTNYQGSASGTLTISAWTLKGFYSPVDMTSTSTIVWNTVKNGSTVPLKFNVFAGTTERTSTADIQGFSAVKVTCSATGIDDAIEEFATTGGTSLRYSDSQFIQNWATPKSANTCYKVTVTTRDASSISAYFKLK